MEEVLLNTGDFLLVQGESIGDAIGECAEFVALRALLDLHFLDRRRE